MTQNRIKDPVVLSPAADAARFLAQATFGADMETINALAGQDYGAWIDDQKTKPISLTHPYMADIYQEQLAHADPNGDAFPFYYKRVGRPYSFNFPTPWMRNIVHGEDQLRQRITWCLSQICVVSYSAIMRGSGETISKYYDLLATHALGNYRDLLLGISTNTAMAYYLSSLGNEKADPSINRYPDENYAREIMQLFSIGLWDLNHNGTRKTDADGNDIPSYTNDDITELARVFTGLWYEDRRFGKNDDFPVAENRRTQNLAMFEDRHDVDEKVMFVGKNWEETLPAGQTGLQDIEQAVDMLFNHPNTPPFICKQLIQFLVKSQPSNGYVRRIVDVFRDNGNGVRGDLFAVVKAILLDDDARVYDPTVNKHGKLIEPMVRITRLVKAFKAGQNSTEFQYWQTASSIAKFGQWPMASPTVFNFFEPAYSPPQTPLGDQDVNAPEFMIVTPVTVPEFANYLSDCIFGKFHTTVRAPAPDFVMDLTDEAAIAADDDALIAHLNLLLCYGEMQPQTEGLVRRVFDRYPADTPENIDLRIKTAIYIIAMSPDGAILQ